MSELIDTHNTARHARGQLLATASALALLASICAAQGAQADEGADRPTVWIELGGNLERVDGGQEAFAPAFVLKHLNAPYNVISPLSAQKLPRHSFGGGAKFTFEPAGTDWLFTAALRYGRSNSNKHLHQQTMTNLVQKTAKYNDPVWGDKNARKTRKIRRFNDLEARHSQSYAVLDFMAGKDVGLGRLGTSALSLGVRFAQFQSKSNIGFKSFPDPRYSTIALIPDLDARHHSYFGQLSAERNFRGVGPALSWENATPLVTTADKDSLTFDWGVNAALLFGRQKANTNHHTSTRYFYGSPYIFPAPRTNHTFQAHADRRSKSKIVPNVGAFAGLSARYSHAKFSLGYRGDFFIGAMDGGIDARDTRNRSFYGPFATFSIGL